MQDDALQILEQKVMSAIGRIKDLRQENEQLRAQNETLQEQVASLQDEVDRTRTELDTVRSRLADFELMEQKRKLIEEKVGGLLAKLEALE